MNEREADSQTTAAQMSDALARWEKDMGALARTALCNRDDGADSPTTETVFADVAIRQGLILERRDDNGAANYRLVPRGETRLPLNYASDFKLTLEDVETILMNRNPARLVRCAGIRGFDSRGQPSPIATVSARLPFNPQQAD